MTAPTSEAIGLGAAERIAERFRVLGDATRLLILDHLRIHGEVAAGELAVMVGGNQQNVSKHLSVLRLHGLVARRKLGTRLLYRVADPSVYGLCAGALASEAI